MKPTKFIRFPKPRQEHEHAQFQIQITKQEKQEHEHYMCKTKIQQDFVVKNKTGIEQSCDKKTYPKLMLNKLKVIQGPAFIYTP